MKKTRFTEEQMVTILREADERPVPEVAKKHGLADPSARPVQPPRRKQSVVSAAVPDVCSRPRS